MRRISISIFFFLLSTICIYGQAKIITGKIITEDFEPIGAASILNENKLLLGTSKLDGQFKIEIPIESKTLYIGGVGFETATINLAPGCNCLDVILLLSSTYDFISLKKVDKLRWKQFKKLPELHLTAFQKGIFTADKPCYEEMFIPYNNKSK